MFFMLIRLLIVNFMKQMSCNGFMTNLCKALLAIYADVLCRNVAFLNICSYCFNKYDSWSIYLGLNLPGFFLQRCRDEIDLPFNQI